ncbi:MAG: hypothetical protein U0841_24420 [Chloroflexia bacterium]
MPDASATRPVGPALARAAALVFGALSLIMPPLIRLFIYKHTGYYDCHSSPLRVVHLLSDRYSCLCRAAHAKSFPHIGRWLWIPAALPCLAGAYVL